MSVSYVNKASKDTEWKARSHSSLYVKFLVVAKQSASYIAIYFDSTYRCEKEEELLRITTTKVYPHVGPGQKEKGFIPFNFYWLQTNPVNCCKATLVLYASKGSASQKISVLWLHLK